MSQIKGQEFHSIIESIFGDVRGLNVSEQIQTHCPLCQQNDGLMLPDGKFNLEINTFKRQFHCWKCESPKFGGALGNLIKRFGTELDYKLYLSYAQLYHDYNSNVEEKEYEIVKLPQEMISFINMDYNNKDHFEAYSYLILDRKVSKDLIIKYKLGFCLDGKYKNRIIIPSYDKYGMVNYFVARTYKNVKPTYLNPDADKDEIIFNEGHINWDSTVYLVEGGFDFLSFPVNTIMLLGKRIPSKLFFEIKERKPYIIIMLDPDAHKSSVEIFQMLNAIYINEEYKIRLVKLPGNSDIDELRKMSGNESIIEQLYNARQLVVDDYFS